MAWSSKRQSGSISIAISAALGLSLGCGPSIGFGDETGGTDEDGSSSAATTTTTTTSTSTSTSTTGPNTTSPPPGTATAGSTTSATGVSFLDGFDHGNSLFECDVWAQDCPRGEKCMPWANDGGMSWNATRCSPVAEDPGLPGDPCTVEGSGYSGIDNCDLGVMCWDVDSETNEGTCVAMCIGSLENPACEDETISCSIAGNTVLALCIPSCDPLAQDCPEGEACYALENQFLCVDDASGRAGAPGDPCEFINVCDPGALCAPSEFVPDCMSDVGCCTSFCTVGEPMPPCLPGQICAPYFAEGLAPPGLEEVGVCALP